MDDLEALKTKWLGICGACDAGMGECSHPDGDYRPVMLELVREVERLRLDHAACEVREDIEIQTPGLRYPVSDMSAAWLQYGKTRAAGREAKIMVRTVHLGAWREATDAS